MRVLHFLYDAVSRRSASTYREWCKDQDEEKAARQAEIDRDQALKQAEDERLRAERLNRSRLAREESERERKELDRLYLEMKFRGAHGPLFERLSKGKQRMHERQELEAQILRKEGEVRHELELEELRKKLANVEADARAERAPKPSQPAKSAQPVTPHLSEEQMEAMARKVFAIQVSRPEKSQFPAVKQWVKELTGKYGELIAEELGDRVFMMLDEHYLESNKD